MHSLASLACLLPLTCDMACCVYLCCSLTSDMLEQVPAKLVSV